MLPSEKNLSLQVEDALERINALHKNFYDCVSRRKNPPPYVGQACLEDLERCIELYRNGTPLTEVVPLFRKERREITQAIYKDEPEKLQFANLTDVEAILLDATLTQVALEINYKTDSPLAKELHKRIIDSI
jgi:hypothetical protein